VAGSSAESLFGKGSIIEQILVWQVLGQVMGAVLGPELQLMQNAVNLITQAVQLSPAVCADMVVRNILTHEQGEFIAKQSGLSPDDFRALVLDTGDAPAPQQLMEALRRGIIQWDTDSGGLPSALHGLQQGRLRDEWAPLIRELGFTPIPVADAVDAVVEGQISYAEGEHIAYLGGIKAPDFKILFNTRGNPPGPMELVDLVRRGHIPMRGTGPDVTSLQQGIFEGATKDKWEPHYEQLAEALPPPRTVTALLRAGSITDQQAAKLFQQAGLSQEMAAAYVNDAHHQKLAASKDLAKADIETLYRDQMLSAADATTMIESLGFSAEDAAFLLSLQDVKRVITAVQQAIGRIHTLYVARKIDATAAIGALNSLHVPDAQVQQLLATWDVERGANVKVLSQAEIASAFFYQIIDQATAMAELQNIGFTPLDAWIILSVRMHKQLPNQPAPGPATAGG
jgi:hypothetical protein